MSDATENWIKLQNGVFTCQECENDVKPLTSSLDGMIEANLEEVRQQLVAAPTKIMYGICPVCGMEYVFKFEAEDLYLEPSDEEK